MTKLFNDPARFTEDMLAGFLDANARYVTGVPGGVVRANKTRAGKVGMLAGGVVAGLLALDLIALVATAVIAASAGAR